MFVLGCRISSRRSNRRHAHPREVVPGDGGLVPELAQHNARAGRSGRVFHAPGDRPRPGVDGQGRVPRRLPAGAGRRPRPRKRHRQRALTPPTRRRQSRLLVQHCVEVSIARFVNGIQDSY